MPASRDVPIVLEPADAIKYLQDKCVRHGSINAIRIFCRSDRCTEMFCMVEMSTRGSAQAATADIGGSVMGYEVCTFLDLPPEFRCVNRVGGRMTTGSCSICRHEFAS